MRGSWIKKTFAGIVILVVAAKAVKGQDDPNTGIRFNLVAPGARSLGMGGAFLGLADDATAAYTNPAGLTNLTVGGPEAAAEFRAWNNSNRFISGGHIAGAATGVGIDTVEGRLTDETSSRTNGLSFLSVGYVLPHGVTFALYRHELANFKSEWFTQGIFIGECEETPESDCLLRTNPRHVSNRVSIANYGLSGAWELPEHRGHHLSLGLGLSYYRVDSLAKLDLFKNQKPLAGTDRKPGEFRGPADFLADNLAFGSTERGVDGQFAANLGFLWKMGKEQRWSVGGVYRQGPKFETIGKVRLLPTQEMDAGTGQFRVPDFYGLGIAYGSPQKKTKLTLDYGLVRYSQQETASLQRGVLRLLANQAGLEDPFKDFRTDDAGELHAGMEQVIFVLQNQIVATLRLGAWYQESSETRFIDDDQELRSFFRPLIGDQVHFSAGLGLVIREDFQLDAALDQSEGAQIFSFSLVKFF